MIYLPIIGAVALAGGTILQRAILKRKGISVRQHAIMEFLVITLVMLPLIYFFWKIDPEALQLQNILIFVVIIAFSLLANYFTFYSVKWEKINNLEPAKILEPIFVILIAIIFSFFLPGFERNPKIIIPAILCAAALLLSHIKKHHLKFNKYFIAAVFGSFFFGVELVLSKLILEFYNPVTFYFLRCLFIFILALIIFHPKIEKYKTKEKFILLSLGIVWTIYRVAIYYGYMKLGVISTTIIFMLGPVLVYLFAHIFLKEKYNWRNILASVVIIASIVYTL